jgi:hypothetical protein
LSSSSSTSGAGDNDLLLRSLKDLALKGSDILSFNVILPGGLDDDDDDDVTSSSSACRASDHS